MYKSPIRMFHVKQLVIIEYVSRGTYGMFHSGIDRDCGIWRLAEEGSVGIAYYPTNKGILRYG